MKGMLMSGCRWWSKEKETLNQGVKDAPLEACNGSGMAIREGWREKARDLYHSNTPNTLPMHEMYNSALALS